MREALATTGHETTAGHKIGQVVQVGDLDSIWFAGGGEGGSVYQTSASWPNSEEGRTPAGTPGQGGRGGGAGVAGNPDGISQGGHALPHTGGGGGGSGLSRTTAGSPTNNGKGRGGDGGSGVAIIRWLSDDAPGLTPAGAIIHEHAPHRYAIFLHSPADGDRSTSTLSIATDLSVEYL